MKVGKWGLMDLGYGAGNGMPFHPIPDPPRTKRSYEFTDFNEQAFGAAYAVQACEETAAAKRRDSLSSREDAAGRSVRLLAPVYRWGHSWRRENEIFW